MESRETLTISLPPSLRAKVEELLRRGNYGSASEYFRELVRHDLKRREQEDLETNLLRALESGPSSPMTAEDWDDIRRKVRERAAKRVRKRAG